jgi:hypothetical protein
VGVAVLTNTHGSRLPLALGLMVIDRLLDLEPLPWSSRLGGPALEPPAPAAGVDAPRPLPTYEGTFCHPAYGELGLRVRDGMLTPSFHGLDDQLDLRHVGDDAWRLSATSVPGFDVPVSFTYAPTGEVTDVNVGLEPALAPLVFQRV